MRSKRIWITICLVIAFAVSMAGCARADDKKGDGTSPVATQAGTIDEKTGRETKEAQTTVGATKDASEEATTGGSQDTSESGALVIYFSRTGEQYSVGVIDKGNTAIVAEMIAEKIGADLFEILPQEDHYPYTYKELTDVAKQEQNDNARPAYRGGVPDLSKYDTVFIGAPVWWGDWPMIMYTFFENEDLKGKTLVPFCTHEGSGLSGFDKKLAAACPDSTVSTGLAIRGQDAQNKQDSVRESVNQWLSDLE